MSELSVENKLQLVRQVKNQYHKNQYDLTNREQILYGRTSSRSYDMEDGYIRNTDITMPDTEGVSFHSRIRLILAVVLAAIFIICDSMGVSVFGCDTDTISAVISQDVSEEMENWFATSADTIGLQAPQ